MTKQSAASGSSALFTKQSSSVSNASATKDLSARAEAASRTKTRKRDVLAGVMAAVLAVLGAMCASASAQTLAPSWYQQSPATSPSARGNQVMAYDSAHAQVVLFGGGGVSDTWLWNGTNWRLATTATSPSARVASQMAYDPAHGQVVMFGGLLYNSNSLRLGDTWLWDGTNWTQATVTGGPSARDGAAMVYDPVHGQIVLFGGIDQSGNSLNDTWLWNGTTWTQATPGTSPSARFGHRLAYDAATGQVLLFGGDYSGYFNDTWVWNGTNWTQQQPATSPSARYDMGMDYDAALGQIVLFGGQGSGGYLNDTWLWSGSNWTQYTAPAPIPSQRELNQDVVYDAARGQMLLFGGLNFNQPSAATNDTWEFGLPGNFGNVNVCPSGQTTPAPCSRTVSFLYNITAPVTFSAPQVVTQGISGLDFMLNPNGTTCTGFFTGGTCTISVIFSPLAPGLRSGSIQLTGLLDNNSTVVTSTPIYGVGQGPAAAIAPGTPSTAASGFTNPYGAAVDVAGNVYVADNGGGTVSRTTPSGVKTQIGVTFSAPTGVAVDGAGDVFIADHGRSAIIEVPAGCIGGNPCQNTLTASTGVQEQTGVAVDGAGDVFFTSLSPAQVTEIPAGCTNTNCTKVIWAVAGETSSQPNGVAVDAAGDVFIADGVLNHILEIPASCASAGCQVNVGTALQAPTDVAVDAAGDVFISDANLGVIEVPAGCTSFSCQTTVYAGGAPFGVALDGQGNIIVPLLTGQAVVKVTRAGTQTLNFPDTTVGTTSTASVTLQNIGNQTLQPETPGLLTVSGASYANTPGPGSPADCSATASLSPGGSCNVSVLFSPQSYTQPNTGTAVFADNSLNAGSAQQTVSLFGMGVKPVQNFYQVTVTEPGSGSGIVTDVSNAINCTEINGTSSGTCAARLPSNGTVTFNATPAGGSTFQGWGGACANAGTNTMCSVVLTQATTITANFVNPVSYGLAVTEPGTGTGTVIDSVGQILCAKQNGFLLATCSSTYPAGTPVTLTATALGNSVFVGWGGACSSSGANTSCVVTMNSALDVSASFVAPTAQAGTLAPITAGVVYGQGGSFTSNVANNGGVTAGSLDNPQGMFVDSSGSLYVADSVNNRVLFYPAGSTTPTRVYGQGGSFTSNNVGTDANSLNNPQGIAVDGGGNVYVSDDYNNRVLYYPAGSSTATRVYGQGGSFTSGAANNGGVSAGSLNDPKGIALDNSGNLYVADFGNSRILFYPSGSTTATRVYGQGGSFTSNVANNGGISANSLNQAQAVALDNSGDLYAADIYNNRVLFYPANSTTATQVYGQSGSFLSGQANNGGVNAGSLNNPVAVAVDSNNGLYIADRLNNRVLYYPFGTTNASRVYGQGGSFTSAALSNGGASANSLNQPWGVAVGNNGNPYIADYGNNRVLGFGSFGNVNVCPANQRTPAPCNNTVTYSYAPVATTAVGATQVVTQGATGLDFSLGSNSCKGTITAGSACNVNVNFAPLAPGLRMGAVQLFDNGGNMLAATPIYGVGQAPQIAFGPGYQSVLPLTGLHYNVGVAADAAGNTYVADYTAGRVVKYSNTGVQTTVPATGVSAPIGIAVDGAGNLYIVDLNLSYIVKITPGGVQTAVGSGLAYPAGIALDGAGDIFVSDQNNNRVVEITPGGVQTPVPTAGLNQPWGVAVDASGNVFVADGGNSRVLKVTPGGVQMIVPAIGLSQPYGIALDAAGSLYIADPRNARVVEIPAAGPQITVGSGLNYPSGLTVDGAGNLLIGDQGAGQVFKLNRSQPPQISFATTNVGSTSVDSPVSFAVQNIGNQPLNGSLALNLGGSFRQTLPVDCASFSILPGSSCSESFSFTPQSATFFSGTATFTDNALNSLPLATQTTNIVGIGATNGVAATVAVPNVVGQTQTAAATPIAGVGLAMGSISTAASQTVPAGSIISENPVAGTQVAVGSIVNLLVSSGIAQPVSPNPLVFENNYFVTGDFVSAGVTLRASGIGGMATGTISVPSYALNQAQGVPDGADVVDAFLYWETIENTPFASSTNGKFNGYPIVGQQIGNDLPNYIDGQFNGTVRAYRAAVNAYLPVGTNGIRIVSGNYTVSLPDGKTALPITEGASLVMVYRVLSPNFPLKSVVIYDGAAAPAVPGAQVVQGFYDAVGGGNGTGKSANLYTAGGVWNSSANPVTLGKPNQYSAPLNTASAYTAVILSTPVNNSDNDGILNAWKAGPTGTDFHAGQPGYYDVKTGTWVGLPGAKAGQKDLFVQLDYMCGALLASGACDPAKENLFPSPDASGNDPLAMVQQAFANSGVKLHLQIGNAVPEDTCTDGGASQLCQFPGQPGVIGWKNSLEFSKLYPRNLVGCLTGGDCTTRFPYGQKDSYHYILMGHSLAIPAWNTRYKTLTSINAVNGVTTVGTVDRGTGINACPSRITLAGVIGDPLLNGVYNTTGCADTKTISFLTPGVPNYTYPNAFLPEPVIGLTSGTVTSISGYSDLGGADSAVTLGLWLTAPNQDMSKKANVLAGTIFHEVGHTLGLGHGGLYFDTPGSYIPTFEGNCKPNYQSVMNYLFQLDLVGPNQTLAFSNQTLATLNENNAGAVTQLTDTLGKPATFPTSAWYVPYTAGSTATPSTRHCDGTPLNGDSAYRVDASIAPISPAWSSPQDISFTGTPLQASERGFNDLTNMDLRQVGATGGQFASLASLLSFGTSVAPLNISAGGTVTLGSGGTASLGSGGTVTLGSGGNITLGSSGTVTLGSGGTVTLGSGGNLTVPGGSIIAPGSSGTVTLGSGGTVTLGSGGTVTLGSGGTITGSGGTVVIPSSGGTYSIDSSGGTVTLGSGGTVTLGSGGIASLSSGGTVTLGSGGTVTLGSGGTVTLGSGGTVTLGSGGTVTLGSGGNVTLGGGGTVTLGSGGTVTLGSGGTVTLGSGGTVTLGSGGSNSLSSGGTVTLGSGGTATLGAGGTVTLGSGGTVTLGSGGVTLSSGGTVTLGSGGTVTLGSGGTVTLGSGGTLTPGGGGAPISVGPGIVIVGSGGTVTLGSGGTVTLGSGGTVTLGSGGTVTLGSGGTVTLGSGGTVTLGSGGVVTLGTGGGSVSLGSGSGPSLASVSNITPSSGGPLAANELTYETANSVVRPPSLPTETKSPQGVTPASVRVNWNAPTFGVVQTYTIYRSSNGAAPIVIGSVSGVNGNAPATEFTDTNPDLVSQTVVYTVTTTLVPDTAGAAPRQSVPSPPAVLKNDQTIVLGAVPSSVLITSPLTVTATAMSGGVPNGLQVVFSATGSCAIGGQSILSNVSSATVTLNNTGSCTVIAAQPGSTSFNAANSVSGTTMILPQGSNITSQTISFAALPNVQYGGSFSLSATSSARQPVSFAASGACTTAGVTTGVGLCSITANAPATSTLSAASLTQSFNIYPAVLKVTAANASMTYGQPVPPLTYGYSGFVRGDTAAVVFGAPTLSTTATSTSNAGSYPITVSTGTLATTNYSFLYVTGALTVLPASQTITFTTNPPASAVFGSTFTVAAVGGASGNKVTFTSAGACSNSGALFTMTSSSGTCSVIANQAGSLNYAAAAQVTKTVTVTGPLVTVSSSNLNFGTVYAGSISAQLITLTNAGTAPAIINDPFISIVRGGNSNEFVAISLCPKPLAPGKSCTVLIGFIAGPFYTPQTATLQIMSNAPGSPQAVTMTATVINPQASFSPSSLKFGTVKHGTSSTLNVTLSNPGGTPLALNGVSITGASATSFVQNSTCVGPLAAGASCNIAVKFTPAAAATFSAVLTVSDNAQAGSGKQTVLLSGTGN